MSTCIILLSLLVFSFSLFVNEYTYYFMFAAYFRLIHSSSTSTSIILFFIACFRFIRSSLMCTCIILFYRLFSPYTLFINVHMYNFVFITYFLLIHSSLTSTSNILFLLLIFVLYPLHY